jgi:hypothetical protein
MAAKTVAYSIQRKSCKPRGNLVFNTNTSLKRPTSGEETPALCEASERDEDRSASGIAHSSDQVTSRQCLVADLLLRVSDTRLNDFARRSDR